MFRRFATEHPSLFSIGIQRNTPLSPWPDVRRVASASLALLKRRIQRIADAGGLGGRTVDEVTLQFHALCEGSRRSSCGGRPRERTGTASGRTG
jgi:hypothetical protein